MISVVVPVKNEGENIKPLVLEIVEASKNGAPVTEIIYVDDGSTDKTFSELKALQGQVPMLKIVRHSQSAGQSFGTLSGVKAATNPLIVTLDGDGQNNPADIAQVYAMYAQNKSAHPLQKFMVAGQRKGRQDTWVRKISSRIANKIRSTVLQDGTRDTGCSLKLFTKEDYLSLPYFNHMHRFIPALMSRHGVKVLHADVSHRARTQGVSKYGTIDRALAGAVDLFGVWWLLKRKPANIVVIKED